MGGLPFGPGRVRYRNRFKPLARQRSADRFTGDVAPQRLGLTVHHDQAVPPQHAGDDEGKSLAFELSGVDHARSTERLPCGCEGNPSELVIDDLVAIELPQRVGAGLVPDDDPEDRLCR